LSITLTKNTELFNRINPIRAKLVSEIKALDRYVFSGHSVIMGKVKRHWQDLEWVLGLFDDRLGVARRRYKPFVAKGISEGRRDDCYHR